MKGLRTDINKSFCSLIIRRDTFGIKITELKVNSKKCTTTSLFKAFVSWYLVGTIKAPNGYCSTGIALRRARTVWYNRSCYFDIIFRLFWRFLLPKLISFACWTFLKFFLNFFSCLPSAVNLVYLSI